MNISNLNTIIVRIAIKFFGLFKTGKKRVFFMCFSGNQYACNPRAISEMMHIKYPEYELVWCLKNKDDKYGIMPTYIKKVKRGTIKQWYYFATSVAIVNNTQYTWATAKGKKQFFIQTWHGDRGFKNVLYNEFPNANPRRITDNLYTDLCVAGSYYGVGVYRTAFKYSGEIINIGCPRNDCLVNWDISNYKDIKSVLNIDFSTKVLVFAPTYNELSRDNQEIEVDLNRVISALERNGEKWICLIRGHVISKINSTYYGEKFMNVSDYPDMADLLVIADMLITDISSSVCDYAIRKKPVILTNYGNEAYEKSGRTYRVKIDEPGFIVANSNDELIELIESTPYDKYVECCEKALDFYSTCEYGNSAEEVCNRIDNFYSLNYLK